MKTKLDKSSYIQTIQKYCFYNGSHLILRRVFTTANTYVCSNAHGRKANRVKTKTRQKTNRKVIYDANLTQKVTTIQSICSFKIFWQYKLNEHYKYIALYRSWILDTSVYNKKHINEDVIQWWSLSAPFTLERQYKEFYVCYIIFISIRFLLDFIRFSSNSETYASELLENRE